MTATIAVLAWVLVYVAAQGLKYLGPSFFTTTSPGNPATGRTTTSSTCASVIVRGDSRPGLTGQAV